MKKILIFLLMSHYTIHAKSTTEEIGDVLTLLIPAAAYGVTLYNDDTEGQMEFYKSYGGTVALTHLLKETVRAPRPNQPDSHTSFPSGHTSSAFSGATFIHKKYGFNYAIPAYVGAIYTGYSRVHAEKHFTKDVVVGALLGIGFSWYFTTPYEDIQVIPTIEKEKYGLQFDYTW